MNRKFLFAIFAVIVVSCSSNNNETLVVNLDEIIDSKSIVNLSDFASEVFYVPLESCKEALIGNIQKIIIVGDRIYVSDISSVGSRLLLYNSKGRFLRQIGSVGNGPGEYGQISDFSLGVDNNELIVISNNKKNILRYCLDGDFIGNGFDVGDDVSLHYYKGMYYSHYPSNMLFYKNDREFQLMIRDKSGEVISSQYPVDKSKGSYLNPFIEFATFSQNKHACFYHVPKDNVLYQIQDSNIVVTKKYSFGKYSFSPDFIWDYNNIQKAKSMDMAFIQTIQVAANYVFIKFSRKNKPGLIIQTPAKIINAGDGEFFGIKDDIDGCGYINNFWVSDSVIFDVIAPYEFPKNFRTDIPISKKADRLFSSVQGDNYVVRIIRLKN
jgi:hypothetical protein